MRQANQTIQAGPATGERRGPPLPKFMVRMANPLLKAVLRSRFHKRMSDRLMILTFTGRKSGRRYATPVGYVRSGSEVFLFTQSSWRHNFKEPAPVSMRIQGEEVQGTARLVSDPAQVKKMIQVLTAAHGETLARRMGFWVENLDSASPEEVQRATEGTYFIEIVTGTQDAGNHQ